MIVFWFAGHRTTEQLLPAAALAGFVTAALAYLLHRSDRSSRIAQRAVDSLRARTSGFVEAMMDPIVSIDENQRVILFNEAAEKVFRWPRNAVLGQPIDMLIPARFRAVHGEHIRRFASTGVTARRMGDLNALTAIRADGEEFPIDASISQHEEDGHRILTVILRDVTERERAKALLATGESRLRGILDSAMDAIITVDQQQRVVLFNDAAETMFGCPREQALGAPLAWFIPDRFRSAHTKHVEQFGTTGVTARRMGGARVVTGLRRNGEEFPIDAAISQLTAGDARFYTVILRDVSDRARTLEDLARSRDELRELASAAHSAREREQTRIARELHDEISQSMAALKMDISLMRGADPALAKRLDRMEVQVNATITAMRRIAADLRPLSLDDLGLVPALETLVRNFERQSGVRSRLASDVEHPLPAQCSTAVYRIVQESLTNVGKHARASSVDVKLVRHGDSILVTVVDDGVGFAPGDAPNPQSFGLLGIRERAYLLKGRVDIQSEPDRGTTISVVLPVDADSAAPG